MILFVDLRRLRSEIAVIDDRDAHWYRSVAQQGVYRLLEKADAEHGIFSAPPGAVVVAEGHEGRDVTWSTTRSSVALGNTLAFAWDAPIVSLILSGDETRKKVADMVRNAAAGAKRRKWLKAAYSGAPNITKAKKVL